MSLACVFADCEVHVTDEAHSTLFLAAQLADMGASVRIRDRVISPGDLHRSLTTCPGHPSSATITVVRDESRVDITFHAPVGSDSRSGALWTDTAAWALGGLASLTGEPDGPPLAPGTPLASYCAALYGLLAVSAALRTANLSCHIDIELVAVVSTLIEIAGLRYAVDGTIQGRLGDWSGFAGWGLYDCADSTISIALRDKEQLDALARCLGNDDVIIPGFHDFMWGHCEEMDTLNALLVSGLTDVSVRDLSEVCRAARIAFSPVNELPGLIHNHHLAERHVFRDLGTVRVPRLPLQNTSISDHPPKSRRLDGTIALPLRGLKVVDISSVWAGPMATRLLADLGATVVKIGSSKKRTGSYTTNSEIWDRDFYAILADRNKLITESDLSIPAERDQFLTIIKSADVLVENFTPGSLARLQLGHDILLKVNPQLSIIAMPAMGLSGPDSSVVGYGTTIEQAAGIGWLYQDRYGRPHRSGINFSDPIAGLWAAIAGAISIPGVIDLSQQEASLSLMRTALTRYQMDGTLPSAVESVWDQAVNRWTFVSHDRSDGDAISISDVAEVVGSPSAPGCRGNRWVTHPNGVIFPLPVLPWEVPFGSGTAIKPVEMPVPLSAINPINWTIIPNI